MRQFFLIAIVCASITAAGQPDPASLRLAIEDLAQTFGERYPDGAKFLARLDVLEKLSPADPARGAGLEALRAQALLANPLIDFDKLLVIRRDAKMLGLPANWQGNESLKRSGFDNEIAALSLKNPGRLATLYQPERPVFVGDLELHFDATKLLFSSLDGKGRWQVFEMRLDGTKPRPLTGEQPDVDSYDACYLPDGRLVFSSTAPYIGVPCVEGASHVANLYLRSADGNIRRLTVDQEHNWCPTLLPSGRVMYLRWEYADTPHSNSRILFSMNPDGTNQAALYGANSYWPNGVFYARPIPGHPTKFIGIVTGHHGVPRMGELVLFDTAVSTLESDGAIQRIPGRGRRVEPIIKDQLVNDSWPKFLHPYPLSDKHFLVSAQLSPKSPWGVYLVDVFDNIVPISVLPGQALLEPLPVRKTAPPPIIPDRIDPTSKQATVLINDIYHGNGLPGVPRGAVKSLRVFAFHFSYHNTGGLLGVLGMNGPWDIRRTLGTVPVEADGSASFQVPAYLPISVQPLDEDGRSLQVMRSWFTAMPGERVSCAGCHERGATSPPHISANPIAFAKKPAQVAPWYGPVRGFSYPREVQPVIDRYCVGCHDGKYKDAAGNLTPDFRGTEKLKDFKMVTPGHGNANAGRFSVGYANLHRYVRHAGIESDFHVLMPGEFHADTTHLVQILMKGHYGVKLDRQAWDRINTWIDLNTPYHGTWSEELAKLGRQRERRNELFKLHTGIEDDPEAVPGVRYDPGPFAAPEAQPNVAAARPRTAQPSQVTGRRQTIDLGEGVRLSMVLVPAGEFVMGDDAGYFDERPAHRVKIEQPFWLAQFETTNAQFRRFDPQHSSRVESKQAYQFGIHGYPVDGPDQPAVRISWERAAAFCEWLSQRTGKRFTLPTEAQWEYACRAGSTTAMSFGEADADFSRFANLADAKLSEFASDPYTVDKVMKDRTVYDDYVPKEMRFNDGGLVTMPVGRYQPNAWGLHDMHGNAAEWTSSAYKPYPFDGRNNVEKADRKVVRGGSWRDRPRDARSANRISYPPYRGVFNVSFRVMCAAE